MSYIVVFVVTWWLILFMLLPVGIKTQEKADGGNMVGSPENPRILFKMAITTVIALIVTSLFFFLMTQGYLDFVNLRGM